MEQSVLSELIEPALCVIKPDAMKRGLAMTILRELINEGLEIVELQRVTMSSWDAARLYEPHRLASFFDGQLAFMTSGESMIIKVEAQHCSTRLRKLVVSIRSRMATSIRENVVHGSDSPEAGVRETEIFFPY